MRPRRIIASSHIIFSGRHTVRIRIGPDRWETRFSLAEFEARITMYLVPTNSFHSFILLFFHSHVTPGLRTRDRKRRRRRSCRWCIFFEAATVQHTGRTYIKYCECTYRRQWWHVAKRRAERDERDRIGTLNLKFHSRKTIVTARNEYNAHRRCSLDFALLHRIAWRWEAKSWAREKRARDPPLYIYREHRN